ncbi:MAG: hypothetical protein ACK5H1_08185 [Tenacibaculum sp.]
MKNYILRKAHKGKSLTNWEKKFDKLIGKKEQKRIKHQAKSIHIDLISPE